MTEKTLLGEEITLGGEVYTLPPLPIIYMSKIKPLMRGVDAVDGITEDYTTALVDTIYFSLKRNHPTITKDTVSNNLDTTNFEEVLEKFMTVNKYIPKEPQPGEAPAAADSKT